MNGTANIEADAEFCVSVKPARSTSVVSAAVGYEHWASTYDDAPNPLLAREERYLSPLLTGLRAKSVLDLACGTGRWLEILLTHGSKSGVGIDFSSAMLCVAAGKNTTRRGLVQAVCERLPLASGAFDLAVCSFALGHIRDVRPVVRELKRVTKVGADVFVSDLHPEAYAQGWRVGFRYGATPTQIETQARSADEIVGAFSTAGFKCKEQTPLWLGETEKPLFDLAGKSSSFEWACRVPAVIVCHFQRVGTSDGDLRG